MSRLGIAVACAALAVAGCGVTTVERSYDDGLIRELGTGSTALKRIETTLDQRNLPGNFNDPATERAMELLLRGQLDKLTSEDMRRMSQTNRRSRRRFDRVLAQLRDIQGDLQAARVDVAAHQDLSEGAQTFLRRWNDYLDANRSRVGAVHSAFARMRPLFGQFDQLLGAAVDTARLQSTARFDRLRRRMFDRLGWRFQRDLKSVVSIGDADRQLVDLVNHDQEANAIVQEVNKRYPDGFLAETEKGS